MFNYFLKISYISCLLILLIAMVVPLFKLFSKPCVTPYWQVSFPRSVNEDLRNFNPDCGPNVYWGLNSPKIGLDLEKSEAIWRTVLVVEGVTDLILSLSGTKGKVDVKIDGKEVLKYDSNNKNSFEAARFVVPEGELDLELTYKNLGKVGQIYTTIDSSEGRSIKLIPKFE